MSEARFASDSVIPAKAGIQRPFDIPGFPLSRE